MKQANGNKFYIIAFAISLIFIIPFMFLISNIYSKSYYAEIGYIEVDIDINNNVYVEVEFVNNNDKIETRRKYYNSFNSIEKEVLFLGASIYDVEDYKLKVYINYRCLNVDVISSFELVVK